MEDETICGGGGTGGGGTGGGDLVLVTPQLSKKFSIHPTRLPQYFTIIGEIIVLCGLEFKS